MLGLMLLKFLVSLLNTFLSFLTLDFDFIWFSDSILSVRLTYVDFFLFSRGVSVVVLSCDDLRIYDRLERPD